MDPLVETLCDPLPEAPVFEPAAPVLEPAPWLLVLLAFLLAEFVPVSTEPRCALCEPVPLVFCVLLAAALLDEFVPVSFEPPGALLLDPVPLLPPLVPPFLVFEPCVVLLYGSTCWPLPP